MNFMLDENFPKAAKELLEAGGHKVFDYREVGMKGDSDELVLDAAISRSAIILTTDRDFFHTLGHEAIHYGIVVIALKKPTRAGIINRLEWFMDEISPEAIAGRSFQLRTHAWLVYPSFE